MNKAVGRRDDSSVPVRKGIREPVYGIGTRTVLYTVHCTVRSSCKEKVKGYWDIRKIKNLVYITSE